MADIRDRVEAEYEAIDNIFSMLPGKPISKLSQLELAGMATLIHNFYNGVENILKEILKSRSIDIPAGLSWHQELLIKAKEEKIISDVLADKLKEFLAFRHFFSHAYALDLHPSRIESLSEKIEKTFEHFKVEVNRII